MKAITLCQPYASLIVLGEKRIENRTWPTKYRGPILVHAGQSRKWLDAYDPLPEFMPFGAILGVARLAVCIPLTRIRQPAPLGRLEWVRTHEHTEGPWCWVLENVTRLADPIPYTGRQGLFNIPDDVLPDDVLPDDPGGLLRGVDWDTVGG